MQAGDLVKVVDDSNNEIGEATRGKVRAENLWHRASYIFIRDTLTQKFVI